MTASAKSLAIQYAEAKRQAQNPMAAEDSKRNLIQAENNNNNTEFNASDNNASVSLLLPSPSQSPCESPSPDNANIASNANDNSNSINTQHQQQQHQGTFNKISNGKSSIKVSQAKNRPKSTSMTNLVMDQQRPHSQSRSPSRSQNYSNGANSRPMQRPASRSALDSIHKGMNAKYAGVQSKVLLQNIRPQANGSSHAGANAPQRRAGSTLGRSGTPSASGRQMASSTSTGNLAGGERATLMSRLKTLQEQLEQAEADCEALRQESERDKKLRNEQVAQLKQELQDKLAEHERQNEDQHQKLMEAYELADQNRRAADTVLSESRQRDEEARKKIEELESQLGELKEFVAMKEEMNGKLYELREQLREERERYEEQLKSLHTVFDNEKISSRIVNGKQAQAQSNYFARPRNRQNQFVDSSDSIELDRVHEMRQQQQVGGASPSLGCSKCRTGASKLHKSEYDLVYGSRLSTRMQTTARSAWRSTKKLASSMVTSSVSLTACRHKSASASMRVKKNKSKNKNDNNQQLEHEAPGWQSPSLDAPALQQQHQDQSEDRYDSFNNNQHQQAPATFHTSVIKLEASNNSNPEQQLQRSSDQVNSSSSSFVHKDQNNKLTIVTKYSRDQNLATTTTTDNNKSQDYHDVEPASGSSGPASASGGERSRCESASSGRGTSEDERESAASIQNAALPASDVVGHEEVSQIDGVANNNSTKRHKRRSSAVFKASQLLPVKTANSLKSQFKLLFTMTPPASQNEQEQQRCQQFQAQDPTQIPIERESHQGDQPESEAKATSTRVSQPDGVANATPPSGEHEISGAISRQMQQQQQQPQVSSN